jgi:hypothetical protein
MAARRCHRCGAQPRFKLSQREEEEGRSREEAFGASLIVDYLLPEVEGAAMMLDVGVNTGHGALARLGGGMEW